MLSEELLTPRLALRRYRSGEGQMVFTLVRNNIDRLRDSFPAAIRTLIEGGDPEEWIADKVNSWNNQAGFHFGIRERETGAYIGQISIKNLQNGAPVAEMGYYLDANWEGRGLMSEAMAAMLQFGFAEVGLHMLYLRIATENTGSRRVAEKAGFKQDKLVPNGFETFNGDHIDIWYYKLMIGDFLPKNAGSE